MTPTVQTILNAAIAKGCKILYPMESLTNDHDSSDLRYTFQTLFETKGTYQTLRTLSNEEVLTLIFDDKDENTREALEQALEDYFNQNPSFTIEAPENYDYGDADLERDSTILAFWTSCDPYPGLSEDEMNEDDEVANVETGTITVEITTTPGLAESMAKIHGKYSEAFKKLADS